MDTNIFDASSASLPDVDRIFHDFKQAMSHFHYETPLRRANRLHARQNSIALEQKAQGETDLVFNLLPPGHFTSLKVDIWRILAGLGEGVVLKIPGTVVSMGQDVMVMRNNAAGQVVFRPCPGVEQGLAGLETEGGKSGFSTFPKFVHKVTDEKVAFYRNTSEVLAAWLAAGNAPQMIQQFIQAHTKSATLVKVHWKGTEKIPAVYFISSTSSQRKGMNASVGKLPFLCRNSSESNIATFTGITRTSVGLTVHRSKPIPELNSMLELCIRVLNLSLPLSQRVSEAVFDFIPDVNRQWVLLACDGFRFVARKKIVTKVVQHDEKIDVNFLMYPVIARKEDLQERLKKTNGPGRLQKRLSTLNNALRAIKQPTLSNSSPNVAESLPVLPSKPTLPSLPPPLEQQILTRQVSHFDKLIGDSRLHKETQKASIDLIKKYGGVDIFHPILLKVFLTIYENPEIETFSEDTVNFEQQNSIINSLLRVLKGDCNLYYKETLRKIHSHLNIHQADYAVLMESVRGVLRDMGMAEGDLDLVIVRFKALEGLICRQTSH